MSSSRSPRVDDFLAEPFTGTLTTLRADGSPHVAPVRFTWERGAEVARVLTVDSARKGQNVRARAAARAAICQAVGFRWVTLEGVAIVHDEPERVAEGISRYTARYGAPPPARSGLVVIEIAVDRLTHLNVQTSQTR